MSSDSVSLTLCVFLMSGKGVERRSLFTSYLRDIICMRNPLCAISMWVTVFLHQSFPKADHRNIHGGISALQIIISNALSHEE